MLVEFLDVNSVTIKAITDQNHLILMCIAPGRVYRDVYSNKFVSWMIAGVFRNRQRSSKRNWKIRRIPSPFYNQISKAEKFHSFVQIRSKSHFENEQMLKATSSLITFPRLNWQSYTFCSTTMLIMLAFHNKFSWLSRFKIIMYTHTLSNGRKWTSLSTG